MIKPYFLLFNIIKIIINWLQITHYLPTIHTPDKYHCLYSIFPLVFRVKQSLDTHNAMTLAIFDLDNTLLEGDSDYLWGQFLVEQGIVDADSYEQKNQYFYDQYKKGTLDIFEFLRFSLRPLTEHPIEQLHLWRTQFIDEKIRPILLPKGRELIQRHREQSDTLMIITATNRFVTEPIASELGITHLLATDPEMKSGQYTGEVRGTPCFQEGKVTRLQQWLNEQQSTLEDSWFYSDSHNDLPLLQQVSHPVAVDPDDTLRSHASQQGWNIISLRD